MYWATTGALSSFKFGTLQAPTAPPPINTTLPTSEAAAGMGRNPRPTSIAVLEEFIRQFVRHAYGPMARARLEELKKSQTATIPPTTTPIPQGAVRASAGELGLAGVRIQQVTDDIAETLTSSRRGAALVAGVDDRARQSRQASSRVTSSLDSTARTSRKCAICRASSPDTPVGKGVEVTILRQGREENKTVTLGRQASLTTRAARALPRRKNPGRRHS